MTQPKLFSQLSARAVQYFHPNHEPFRYMVDPSSTTSVDRVVLSEIEEGRLFYVYGTSLPAQWMMRVNETEQGGVVHIWRDLDADGLVGPIERIVLRDTKRKDTLCELGIDIYQRLTQEEYYRLHDGDPW